MRDCICIKVLHDEIICETKVKAGNKNKPQRLDKLRLEIFYPLL